MWKYMPSEPDYYDVQLDWQWRCGCGFKFKSDRRFTCDDVDRALRGTVRCPDCAQKMTEDCVTEIE